MKKKKVPDKISSFVISPSRLFTLSLYSLYHFYHSPEVSHYHPQYNKIQSKKFMKCKFSKIKLFVVASIYF